MLSRTMRQKQPDGEAVGAAMCVLPGAQLPVTVREAKCCSLRWAHNLTATADPQSKSDASGTYP